MAQTRKIGYVLFIGALTSTAVSACYWQSQRYLQARQRWDVIRNQLNQDSPDRLEDLKESGLYPFKYVSVKGQLGSGLQRVDRMRDGRMGYLVVRRLSFTGTAGQPQQIAALQGWCQKDYELPQSKSKATIKQWKGILRQKQKKDYVHTRFKKQDLEKYKMTTYIDLQSLLPHLDITPSFLSQNYYLQILRPLDSIDHDSFPYQYSVDNFELPYLTPDKHLSYAIFWGGSSLVGLFAILKALRLK